MNRVGVLQIHLSSGEDIQLRHDEKAAQRLSELIADGSAETIHTTEPNLETVFMELTGKELAV